jgi:anti-sigma B factor antagonist
MEIQETARDGIVCFSVQGRLDSNTSPGFEDRLFAAIGSGSTRILMDCGALEYISSAGLRVILKAAKELKRQNGAIVLCSMREYVREVFEIAGFDTFIPIARDNTAAETLLRPE